MPRRETFEQYLGRQPVGVVFYPRARAIHLLADGWQEMRGLCGAGEGNEPLADRFLLRDTRLPLCQRCTDIARKEWMRKQREASGA